ncbi:flagellum-associated coiled-coil domain-containing protein 1 [Esox lucius]|uniref:Uncharacterized protein n=1 Tax=Esox lucius TaxID=8010 RepID=A0AAY5K1R6_ESOLU|nr:flagellum-associated coiled-coil domain-containing protein 1 [Esox lucius]
MQEQMGKLTALLKDERRSHHQSCRALLEEAEWRAERVKQQQQLEMEQLMQAHRSEISALVDFHTKTLERERGCAEERCALLEKDYDFLKSSFRTYKDNIFEEMCNSWLRKENHWKEEQERILTDQLMHLSEKLNKSKQEKENQREAFKTQMADLQARFEAEKEVLAAELTDKDVTIHLLKTALQQTQPQLDTVTSHLPDFVKNTRHLRSRRMSHNIPEPTVP